MRAQRGIIAGIDRVSKVFGTVAGVIVVVMMVHIVIDVILRNALRSPLPGTLEYITYWWMPSLIFLSLGAAEYARSHIRVTIIVDNISPRVGTVVNTIAYVITAVTLVILLYFTIQGAMNSFAIRQAALGAAVVPIWLPKIVMNIGLATFLLQVLASIYRELSTDAAAPTVPTQPAEGAAP